MTNDSTECLMAQLRRLSETLGQEQAQVLERAEARIEALERQQGALDRLAGTASVDAFTELSPSDKARWFVVTGRREQAYKKRIQELEDALREAEESADLRHRADLRAVQMWRAATGKDLVHPDHADLCLWLMDRLDSQLRFEHGVLAALSVLDGAGEHVQYAEVAATCDAAALWACATDYDREHLRRHGVTVKGSADKGAG